MDVEQTSINCLVTWAYLNIPIIDPEIYKSETAKRTLVPDYYLQQPVQSAISLKGAPTARAQMGGDAVSSLELIGTQYGAKGRKQCSFFPKATVDWERRANSSI